MMQHVLGGVRPPPRDDAVDSVAPPPWERRAPAPARGRARGRRIRMKMRDITDAMSSRNEIYDRLSCLLRPRSHNHTHGTRYIRVTAAPHTRSRVMRAPRPRDVHPLIAATYAHIRASRRLTQTNQRRRTDPRLRRRLATNVAQHDASSHPELYEPSLYVRNRVAIAASTTSQQRALSPAAPIPIGSHWSHGSSRTESVPKPTCLLTVPPTTPETDERAPERKYSIS